MQNNFQISPATKKDTPVILEFIRQFAEYGNVSHKLVATVELLEKFIFGEEKYANVIIGYLNETPISYALFTYNFSTLLGRPGLYLVDLYVAPEERKQGIAKKMLSHLARLAQEKGCARFEWSVLLSNGPAITLYESIGAEFMNEWGTYRISGDALSKLAEKN